MKLSKKGAAIQRAIHDAIASGNRRRASRYGGQVALGGLLVGLAATVAGCGERHSPAVMGRFPDSRYQENAKNEDKEVFVIEGEMPEPEDIQAQGQEPSETNAVREVQGKDPVLLGKPPSLPPQTNAVQEQQCEKVIRGMIVQPVTTNAVNEADDEAVVMGGVGGDS